MRQYGIKKITERLRNSDGAVSVEYALSMALAAFIMFGIDLLFKAMSTQILDKFIGWIEKPYP